MSLRKSVLRSRLARRLVNAFWGVTVLASRHPRNPFGIRVIRGGLRFWEIPSACARLKLTIILKMVAWSSYGSDVEGLLAGRFLASATA